MVRYYFPVSALVAYRIENTVQDIRRCGCGSFKSKSKSFCGA